MSQQDHHTENRLKEKLLQHEFDFAPDAWDAMEQLIDQTDPPGTGPDSDDDRRRKGGWRWWTLGLLLLIGLTSWWSYQQFYLPRPTTLGQGTTTVTINDANPQATSQINERTTSPTDVTNSSDESLNTTSDNQSSGQSTADKDGKLSLSLASPSSAGQTSSTKRPVTSTSATRPSASQQLSVVNSSATSSRVAQDQTSSTVSQDYLANTLETSFSTKSKASGIPEGSDKGNLLAENAPMTSSNAQDISTSTSKGAAELNNAQSLRRFGQALAFLDLKADSLQSGDLDDNDILADMLEKQFQEAAKAAAPPTHNRWEMSAFIGLTIPTFTGFFEANGTNGLIMTTERGPNYGLGLRYRLNKAFSFEGKLHFSSLKHSLNISYRVLRERENHLESKRIHQLNIPLTTHLNLGNGLRFFVGGGPSLRLYKQSSQDLELPLQAAADLRNNVVNNFRQLLGFYSVGLGYDRGPWVIEIRLDKFFGSTLNEGIRYETIVNQQAETVFLGKKVSESQILITFGRRFGLGKAKFTELPLY